MADLVALLPAKQRAWVPAIEPPPPSGLVPTQPAFDSVAADAMVIGGTVVRIGGGPTVPLHAIECTGRLGGNVVLWPQKRPETAGGNIPVRQMLLAGVANGLQGLKNADGVQGTAWELGEHEVMLTDNCFEVSSLRTAARHPHLSALAHATPPALSPLPLLSPSGRAVALRAPDPRRERPDVPPRCP